MSGMRGAVRQELRLLWREGYALWALVALLLLLVAAGINGRALLGVQTQTATALTGDSQQIVSALAEQAARGVAAAAEPGAAGFSVLVAPAILPPAPLAGLAIGQSDLLPTYYEVTARGEHTFLAHFEIDNPLRLSVGNFDVAFVIVWLLPLLVIALCFNVVSAERERGVLALAVAAGASPARFILGKCATRALILVVAIWVALLAAAVAAGVPLERAEGLLPLLFWLVAATSYAAFWFSLALLVNAGMRASDLNASILAGAWLLLVIIAPALTNLAATTAFAAPSRVALTTALREASEQSDREAAKARDRYFFDHPEMQSGEMDKTQYYQSVARSEASVAQAMRPLIAQFASQAQRQQHLVAALQYLSPGTLTYQLLTSLAGTDGVRHRDFTDQTLQFHAAWAGFFTSRLMKGEKLTRADYESLPRFVFRPTSMRAVLRGAARPLGVLIVISTLLSALAIWRLRRIPVV